MTHRTWRKKVAKADKAATRIEKQIKMYEKRIRQLHEKLGEAGEYERELRDAEPKK